MTPRNAPQPSSAPPSPAQEPGPGTRTTSELSGTRQPVLGTPHFAPHPWSGASPSFGGYEPERAAVNALVWSPGAAERTLTDLHAEQFADPWCRVVIAAVTELVATGRPVSARTIQARLVATGVHSPHDSWRLILADEMPPWPSSDATSPWSPNNTPAEACETPWSAP